MPEFPALTAIGTSRTVDVSSLDRPAVLICFTQATQGDADPVEAAVRAQCSAAEVLVGHVVDLHSIPRMLRSIAEGVLGSEFKKAVAALPAGETQEDYIVILPDWEGSFAAAAGLSDVSKQLGVAIFAKDGRLAGTAQGEDVPAATLRLLEEAGAE